MITKTLNSVCWKRLEFVRRFAVLVMLLPSFSFAEVIINEVMAKNETTLATKSGCKGLDWVELYNSGDTDVDVAGWCLGTNPTKKPGKWPRIEGDCVVPANGCKIVYCDGDGVCASWNPDEAHVACNVSSDSGKHTVFLATAASKNAIVSRLPMPQGFADVSYGYGHLPDVILGENADAEYRIGDGDWRKANGSIGMSRAAGGFKVVTYNLKYFSGVAIDGLDDAKRCIADSSLWFTDGIRPVVTNDIARLACRNGSAVGGFDGYVAIPGYVRGGCAAVVTGAVRIPESGVWTFAVGGSGGVVATLRRFGTSWMFGEPEKVHDYRQTVASFELEAGVYELELVSFNDSRTAGSAVFDCSVASGRHDVFSATEFRVIGDADCALAVASPLGAQIVTDVADEMLGRSDTIGWRASFAVGDPVSVGAANLRVRYSDAFTATLNGTVIASVPAASACGAEAYSAEFPIPAGVLAMSNILEIAATNGSKDDTEFLLSASVVSLREKLVELYFPRPTPGAANADAGRTAPTPVIAFSEPHGYRSRPFDLVLSGSGGRRICYTLDGTRPDPTSPCALFYTKPIRIEKTTVVRAVAEDSDSIFITQSSATYLFLDDILAQNAEPPDGFPANGEVNGQVMHYGLSATVTGDPLLRARLLNGFTNGIRTVSVVMDPKDLFDRTRGIYVNAHQSGRASERPTMLEQIFPPDPKDEFVVACGIRIRGAWSRHHDFLKHGFHVIFRDEYGAGRLEHPLFGDEGAKSFKRIDFRCEQNNAWQNYAKDKEHAAAETMINEVFMRDSQRDMGQPYNRSRYYHLFLNGVYWGVYQSEERVDQHYAADYAGGKREDYDIVRTTNSYDVNGTAVNYSTEVVDGEPDAWRRLFEITAAGYDAYRNTGAYDPEMFAGLQGLDRDGKRDSERLVYLDVTNLVCYMLTSQWGADGDSPSNRRNQANNIIAFRSRAEDGGRSTGFKWIRHDAENCMARRKLNDGYRSNQEYLQYGCFAWRGDATLRNFNPQALQVELCRDPAYRRVFADIVQKQFLSPDGAMTVEACEKRYRARMAELGDAVLGELARWGCGGGHDHTYSTWERACDRDLEFIGMRLPYLISNYRKLGWFPKVDAPVIVDGTATPLRNGRVVRRGERVFLGGAERGRVWYTTDGSDPWSADGSPCPSAKAFDDVAPARKKIVAVAADDVWRYFDAGRLPATDWNAFGYDDSAWKEGAGNFGFASAGSGMKFATALDRKVVGSDSNVKTFFFRRRLTLPAVAAKLTKLRAKIDCDDGYIAYLNGVMVRRQNADRPGYCYSGDGSRSNADLGVTETDWSFAEGLLHEGDNVLAVEVHQVNGNSSDAWWSLALSYEAGEVLPSGGLAVSADGLHLKARILSFDGEWSALSEIRLRGE